MGSAIDGAVCSQCLDRTLLFQGPHSRTNGFGSFALDKVLVSMDFLSGLAVREGNDRRCDFCDGGLDAGRVESGSELFVKSAEQSRLLVLVKLAGSSRLEIEVRPGYQRTIEKARKMTSDDERATLEMVMKFAATNRRVSIGRPVRMAVRYAMTMVISNGDQDHWADACLVVCYYPCMVRGHDHGLAQSHGPEHYYFEALAKFSTRLSTPDSFGIQPCTLR